MFNDEQEDRVDLDLNFQSPSHQRRLPLPTKLTFEQNITNLIEKESPLLQSELLTAEHELSVLRSRLAVNEGVTAVTGSILQSLKEQFQPRYVDMATSPLDIYRINLFQQSLASQTSPMIEALPDIPESVEIHYDAQLPKSAYLVVKAKNSFWIAQPIATAEAQTHLKSFSSPVMKRATLKLPTTFDQAFLLDSDTEDEPVLEQTSRLAATRQEPLTVENVQRLTTEQTEKFPSAETSWSTEVLAPSVVDESTSPANEKLVHQDSLTEADEDISPSPPKLPEEQVKPPISPENERAFPDRKEQISEMKTIRSSSLLPIEHQIEQFDDKIDEIYLIIDHIKHHQVSSTSLDDLHRKIADLRFITSEVQLDKQDELRLEYELDELTHLTNQIDQQEDYSLIELFEQNVNELRRIIGDIKATQSPAGLLTALKAEEISTALEENLLSPLPTETERDVPDWTAEQMAEYFHRAPDGQLLSGRSAVHLVPEDPVITRDVFFEGNTPKVEKRPSLASVTHLIPEDAQVNAENFYEGDIHRSLFPKEEIVSHEAPLVPESPRVSSDVFYEGDARRSMFAPRLSASSPPAIENLREIMSDLMLAASWSKRPVNLETQSSTAAEDEEMLAESFITTEQQYPTSSLCEIVHEIENFPLTSTQTTTLEDRDTISPFSSQSPIIIHRAILTRQETDRWPQEESLLIDESAEQDPPVNTGELEKIASGIRQHAEDWTNSAHQRKEIYGDQYRPERKPSHETTEDEEHQRTSTDETIDSESTRKTSSYEETSDEMILHTAGHPQQERDENDSYHIERTWSTDKILEPPSTVENEGELRSSTEPPFDIPPATTKRSSADDRHRAPSSDDSDDDDQDAHRILMQTPQSSFDSQKLVTHQFIRQPSEPVEHEYQSDRFHLQSSQFTTGEEQQELPLQTRFDTSGSVDKTSPTVEHEQLLSARAAFVASEQREEVDENASDRFSTEEIASQTPQLSDNEEEQVPQDEEEDQFQTKSEADDSEQYPLERKLSEEALRAETPRRSLTSSLEESTEKRPEEHAEIAEQQKAISPVLSDEGQDKREIRSKTLEQGDIDQTDEYPVEPERSVEKHLLQTSRSSGDEQDDDVARQASSRSSLTASLEPLEEKPMQEDDAKTEQQPSIEKIVTQSPQFSDQEEARTPSDDGHDKHESRSKTPEQDETDEYPLESKLSAESRLPETSRTDEDADHLPQVPSRQDIISSREESPSQLSESEDEPDESHVSARTFEHTGIDETHEHPAERQLSADSPLLEKSPTLGDDDTSRQQASTRSYEAEETPAVHKIVGRSLQLSDNEDEQVLSDDEPLTRTTDQSPLQSKLSTESPLMETPPIHVGQGDRTSPRQSPEISEHEVDERDFRAKTSQHIEIDETQEQPLESKSSTQSSPVESSRTFGEHHEEKDDIAVQGSPREAIASYHEESEKTSGPLSGLEMIIRQSLHLSNNDNFTRATTHAETDETHGYPLESKLSTGSPLMETSRTFGEQREEEEDRYFEHDDEAAEEQQQSALSSEHHSRKSSGPLAHAADSPVLDHKPQSTDFTEKPTEDDEEREPSAEQTVDESSTKLEHEEEPKPDDRDSDEAEEDEKQSSRKSSVHEIQLDSSRDSEREDEPKTDPFALQSFQTYEADHGDLSPSSQQIPVAFHQEVEGEDPFSLEHKFSTDDLPEETPSFSTRRSEDDQAEAQLSTGAELVHSQHEDEEEEARLDHQDALIDTSRQSDEEEDQSQLKHERSSDHLVETSSPTLELDQYEMLSSIEPAQIPSYDETATRTSDADDEFTLEHERRDDDETPHRHVEREVSGDYIIAETSPSVEEEEEQPVQSPKKSGESSFDKADDEQPLRRYSDEYEMIEEVAPTIEQSQLNVDYEEDEPKAREAPQEKLSTVKFVVASAASSEVEEEEERDEQEQYFLNESSGKTTDEEYRASTPRQHEEPEGILNQSLPSPSDERQETFETRKLTDEEEEEEQYPTPLEQSANQDEEPIPSYEETDENLLENQLLADTHAQLDGYQKQLQSLEQLSAAHDVSETVEEEEEEHEEPGPEQIDTESLHSNEQKSTAATAEQPVAEDEKPFYDRPSSSAQVELTFTPSSEHDPSDEEDMFDPSATIEVDDDVLPEVKYSYQSPFPEDDVMIASTLSDFERQTDDEHVIRVDSASFDEAPTTDDHEVVQVKDQPRTTSSFESEDAFPMDSQKPTESRSPVTSRVQHASVISRTIGGYRDEEEIEDQDENDFRPTHLDISVPDDTQRDLSAMSTPEVEVVLSSPNATDEYEQVLRETSHEMVNRILEDAFRETVEQEKNFVLQQTATDIVNNVMESIFTNYDEELLASQREESTSADASIGDLTDWSALVKGESVVTSPEKATITKSSDEDEEEEEQTVPISSQSASELNELLSELRALEEKIEDGEENEQSTSHLSDQPYLSVNDVVTSNSTQELGDLVHEMQTLENQINEHVHLIRSSSPSSSSSTSDNDEIHHYDLTVPQITTTTTSSELSNLVSELQTIEEQLEDKLDAQHVEVTDPLAASSQSINELGDLVSELQNVSEQITDRFQQKKEEALPSNDVDTLTREIIQHRRDSQSQPPEDFSHRTERRPSSPPTSPLLKQQFVQITCSSMNDVDQVQDQLRHEHEENQVLQDMINTVIREAQDNVQVDVSLALSGQLSDFMLSLLF